jgi:hypothetical protein
LEEKFEQWAILELMGHRRLAGKVSECAIGGGAFLRIDMPMKDGFTSTQFYSPASIYCITPTTEQIAREVALASQPEPVSKWEFPQLAEKKPQFVPVDSFPDDAPGDEPGGSDFDRDEVPF